VVQAIGSSHAATLPASRRMHLSGYYVLAPWSDVCIILRMLLQLVHVLVRTLAENVLTRVTFARVWFAWAEIGRHLEHHVLVT